ncbi:putative CAMK protein kinase [Rosellinia necatrix]|uniref:non-specific serine/threonine protein kinase n=1 Tax=Rosellinia necatrix TaxID=77044 RepID=A0A1W2TUJ9_ROSNE|nr:putative CAMK protein kinase [Rosellinia necatrix]
MMAAERDLPETVRDSRWEADFLPSPYYPSRIINTQRSGRRLIRRETWTRQGRLGHGGFGVVWLESLEEAHSANQYSASLRAVKELKLGRKDGRRRECIRELEALAKFSQKKFVDSFVEFYSWFESKDALFIATEYCQFGDLKQFTRDNGPMSEPDVQAITEQVLQGIIFMHNDNFAHRDLKPANILIKKRPPDHDWHIKICDMGLSKRIGTEITSTTVKGTPGFIAPERIPGIGSNPGTVNPFPCDMWSLGEISFFLLTGETTFANFSDLQGYMNKTRRFPRERLERVGASVPAKDFIGLLMASEPSDRLSANEADSHLWMTTRNGHSLPFTVDSQKSEHLHKWLANVSIEQGTIPHPKVAQPSGSPLDSTTIASGSWNTATNPIPHVRFSSPNTEYSPVEVTQVTNPGETESLLVNFNQILEEDEESFDEDYPQNSQDFETSSTHLATVGKAEDSIASDDEWDPSDETWGPDPIYTSVAPRILRKRAIWGPRSAEAKYYPSLSSLADSDYQTTKKYVNTMRDTIRYLCRTGGLRSNMRFPSPLPPIPAVPTPAGIGLGKIYEESIEDSGSSGGEASCSYSQKPDGFDGYHPTVRVEENPPDHEDREDHVGEEWIQEPDDPPEPDIGEMKTQIFKGGVEETSYYRSPTVEDADDSPESNISISGYYIPPMVEGIDDLPETAIGGASYYRPPTVEDAEDLPELDTDEMPGLGRGVGVESYYIRPTIDDIDSSLEPDVSETRELGKGVEISVEVEVGVGVGVGVGATGYYRSPFVEDADDSE